MNLNACLCIHVDTDLGFERLRIRNMAMVRESVPNCICREYTFFIVKCV